MSVPPASSNSPSTAAIALATGIVCAATGYLLGQGSSLGLFSSSTSSGSKKRKQSIRKSWPNSYDVTIHPDSSDEELLKKLRGTGINETELRDEVDSEEEDEGDGREEEEQESELSAFPENKEECKLVLVVRTDLGMGKGIYLSISTFAHLYLTRISQAKLPPNARTQPWPATHTFFPMRLPLLSFNAGLLLAKQK